MKAFVVNEDQVITAGLGLMAVIVIVFIAGYYTGSIQNQQRVSVGEENISATDKPLAGAPTATNKLNVAQAKNVVLKQNSKNAAKDKTVNKKEKQNKKSADKKKQVKKTQKISKKNVKENKKTELNKSSKNNKIAANKSFEKNQSTKKKTAQKVNSKNTQPVVLTTNTEQQLNATNNSITPVTADRVYSIQAGMFSSEKNANTFIDKLSMQNFDAYLSGFTASSGATKYNVRVGKFGQRNEARARLKEFQKSFSSPAYVVFSQP